MGRDPTALGSRGIERFPCFDGLRAIAALSVFTFHFLGIHRSTWLRGNLLLFVSRLGSQGVGIFFVISGFLLYRPYVDAARRGVPGPSLGPFWLRRFVRIFPAYWIALTAWVYLFGFFTIRGFANFVTYYGLLQNYRGGYALFGLGIAWTLVIEVSFYIALPLIDQIARALAGRQATAERWFRAQMGLVGALAATGLLVRALNTWVVKSSHPGTWFPLHATGYSLFAYLDWFAIGMAFAVLSVFSAADRPLPPAVAVLGRYASASWVLAFGVYFLETRLVTSAGGRLAIFVLPILIGVVAGFLVLPAVFGNEETGAIRAFLKTKPMIYLGGISYGIYLWHFIFVTLSLKWVTEGRLADVLFVRFLVVATLTLAVASASFYLVEKPLITWSHRVTRRRPLAVKQAGTELSGTHSTSE
jgi:peptidoglycan/LPS O-acetylase OafA/YrhL